MYYRKIYALILFVCINFFAYSQNIGDLRTKQNAIGYWSNSSIWEVYNGSVWISQDSSPPSFLLTIPKTITISRDSKVSTDASTANDTIPNLIIENKAVLILKNNDIEVNDSCFIYGALSNESTIGSRNFNYIEVNNGSIVSQLQTVFTINNNLVLNNSFITGDYPSSFAIKNALHTYNYNTIDKASIFVQEDTYLSGNLNFTSTGGDKTFNRLNSTNTYWHNTVGETFTIKSTATLNNTTLYNEANAVFNFNDSCICNTLIIKRNADFIPSLNINGPIIFKEGSLNSIETANIICETDCIINGTLVFNGKLGNKTIYGNLLINKNGEFNNIDNENFIIHGNIESLGVFNSGNGKFNLQGHNKYLMGNLKFKRLYINGTYINSCTTSAPLTVTDFFEGKGSLINKQFSKINISSPNSAYIESEPMSTIEYFGNTSNTINASNIYNLILNSDFGYFKVVKNLSFNNQIQFKKASHINIDKQNITFETSKITIPVNELYSFSPKANKITFKNLQLNNLFYIGLKDTNTNQFIGIETSNLDSLTKDISIDSLLLQVTSSGLSNTGSILSSSFTNLMLHINNNGQSKLRLYWNDSSQQAGFEPLLSKIVINKNYKWQNLIPLATNVYSNNLWQTESVISNSIIASVQTTTTALPINIISYEISNTSTNSFSHKWQVDNEIDTHSYNIEASEDGVNFIVIKRINCNNKNKYEVVISNEIDFNYYKLISVDYNNEIIDSYLRIKPKNEDKKPYTINNYTLSLSPEFEYTKVYLFTPQHKLLVCENNSIHIDLTKLKRQVLVLHIENDKYSYTEMIYIN